MAIDVDFLKYFLKDLQDYKQGYLMCSEEAKATDDYKLWL